MNNKSNDMDDGDKSSGYCEFCSTPANLKCKNCLSLSHIVHLRNIGGGVLRNCKNVINKCRRN